MVLQAAKENTNKAANNKRPVFNSLLIPEITKLQWKISHTLFN